MESKVLDLGFRSQGSGCKIRGSRLGFRGQAPRGDEVKKGGDANGFEDLGFRV